MTDEVAAEVYVLRPPETVVKAAYKGQVVRLGNITFAYHRMKGQDKRNAALDREIVRPYRMAWRKSDEPRPTLVTLGSPDDHPHGEILVYRWPRLWITCTAANISDGEPGNYPVMAIGALIRGEVVEFH